MIDIELPNLNSFKVDVYLSAVLFGLRFDWNDTGQFWTMGISDGSDNQIVNGIKMVVNYPLLRHYRNPQMPAGELMAIRLDGQTHIGRADFANGSVRLIYSDSNEV